MTLAGRATVWTATQCLKLLLYPFAILFGFLWGLAPFIFAALLWFVALTNYVGIIAHEKLHAAACDLLAVDYEVVGFETVDENHQSFTIEPGPTGVPESYIVAIAPLVLAVPAVLSLSFARTTGSLLLFVAVIPIAVTAVRYSLPTDGDALFLLHRVRQDPFHPMNFFAVPVSLLFLVLGSPRRLHYRLLHLSELLWGLLLLYLSLWVSPYLLTSLSFFSSLFTTF